uniref:Ubiquitin conjugating enzyme n=1 Tax=Coptotermes formosanus TaxID=36987 RepID=R4UJX3_COPFO|nr:ubiquitin conjugating enzyme [Coptotermes formosanus]
MSNERTAQIIGRRFQECLGNEDNYRVSIPDSSNAFKWRVIIIGQKGTLIEGGQFPAEIRFPSNFPFAPPTMKFLCPMFHPNIRDDGDVCISILHPAGDDQYGYEKSEERWRPGLSMHSVFMSVQWMLDQPNPESPHNVEAAKVFRNNKDEYIRRVKMTVENSIKYV